jgi:hypothetical protein
VTDEIHIIALRAFDPIVAIDPAPNSRHAEFETVAVVRLGPAGKYEEIVRITCAADYEELLAQRLGQ